MNHHLLAGADGGEDSAFYFPKLRADCDSIGSQMLFSKRVRWAWKRGEKTSIPSYEGLHGPATEVAFRQAESLKVGVGDLELNRRSKLEICLLLHSSQAGRWRGRS